MNYREDYVFWRLATFFITDQGYRIVQLFENGKELWLEKLENKKAPIIRLVRVDLDWSNAMQRDIEFSAINGERIRKQVGRSELIIHNIYISQYPPVDDYEDRLREPYVHPNGNKTTVNSVLLTSGEYEAGLRRMSQLMDSDITFQIENEYPEQAVESEKRLALEHAAKKAKTEKEIFTNGKPFFTYVFIVIQVVMFLLLETQGGSTNTSTLIKFGAKFNPYIYEGEWWRFLVPIFLHIGFFHLAMNTMALYFLGTAVERIFGNVRFLFIYLFAGVIGFIASFIFSSNVSAGASGAIFGCFGALLYFCLIYPKLFFRTMGPSVIMVLIFNLIFGFSISSIDNAGHLGGLAGGFLAAGVTHFPKKKKLILQMIFLAFTAILIWSSLSYGFSTTARGKDESSSLLLAQEYIREEDYVQAYETLKEVVDNTNKPTAQMYFVLSFTEIKLNKYNDAKVHLEKAVQLDPNLSEAYYNLALIFLEGNNLEQAKINAEQASKLNPDKKEYSNLVNEINQYQKSAGGGE
ncbi:rhomboid family intramembrane serine protease [Bacillus sp. MRMR6]|uniref:rhomboid family protein n=1 Tax=Bacillus sp. MRMR6 TaxID=1928617 RepID=UPI000952D177|nr:rhomboid family intramembrane serine protease [Bacillus sp. MRMR6]OLS41692.1 rhomboid family intramembrane serine protease [Bacillus sp. MRMR6]